MDTLAAKPNVSFTLAIVVSRYHPEITDRLLLGAKEQLQQWGFNEKEITCIYVPGAIEIPIAVQRLARTHRYQAIIALGAVIYGETSHFHYVCEQVSRGCQEVALAENLPVIFGVLTTDNLEQAYARSGGSRGHLGRESVDTAVALVSVLEQIEGVE